ncbi:hypothetical protein [Actinoallomurus sp. CA-142502]|uniref:hypothetical protein n=1 Tax=Actinoallomurus sp. CA-142502 TaxID=3239885 RepID=UPI003D925CA0
MSRQELTYEQGVTERLLSVLRANGRPRVHARCMANEMSSKATAGVARRHLSKR